MTMDKHDKIDAVTIETAVLCFAVLLGGLYLACPKKKAPEPLPPQVEPAKVREQGTATVAPAKEKRQVMVTSFYADYYTGRKTASGEVYNPRVHTAAHRDLPFGTWLELEVAGRRTKVRVNDRGPFVQYRDLDISRVAAEDLGMVKAGVAVVYAWELK